MLSNTELQLPLYREIFANLRTLLPLPATDTPEAYDARDQRAVAAVIALGPATVAEAEQAVTVVAARFHAEDALRAATQPNLPTDATQNYRAQVALMVRTTQSAMRTLLQLRAARWPRTAATTQPQPQPQSAAAEPPPPEKPPYDPFANLTEPEHWCVTHPGPAARIRAERGLPKRPDFNVPKRDIVQAILTGTSPIFRALDKTPRHSVTAQAERVSPTAPSSHIITQ